MKRLLASVAIALTTGLAIFACSGVDPDSGGPGAGADDGGDGDGSSSRRDSGKKSDSGSGSDGGCTGLGCVHDDCTATGGETTLSGTVYAPNGTTPLYNVIVYVPSSTTKLAPFTSGVSCDQCGTVAGTPVTSTTTDGQGHFTLHHVPSGTVVPLVFQLGKWRRQTIVPRVNKCVDNPLTDANQTRLPKNQTEGDMPHIAIASGGCDDTACLLPKLGIDPAEYGTAADVGTKAIIFYVAPNAAAPSGAAAASTLWGNVNELKKYDAVILGCDCMESVGVDAGASLYGGMADYLSQGGRALSLHYQVAWTAYGPAPMPATLQGFDPSGGAAPSGTYAINDTIPKGAAAKAWLKTTDPTHAYTGGNITLSTVDGTFTHVDPTRAQEWIGNATNDVVMSYTMPLTKPAAQRCGKMTYFDGHIDNSATVVSSAFPADCSTSFTQEQMMYTFFFMDLLSCVQDDAKAPILPE
ncbi:MAG: hypothetical protein ABI461_04485 [Polyangiaceae bacterium]